jgi:hypothetical protein
MLKIFRSFGAITWELMHQIRISVLLGKRPGMILWNEKKTGKAFKNEGQKMTSKFACAITKSCRKILQPSINQ